MKRRLFNVLTIVSLMCLATTGFFIFVNHLYHQREWPLHTYPLAGNEALTDEQAISLGKQTLERDGLFSETLELGTFGDDSRVSRGDDKSYVSVYWVNRDTGYQWFVQLHRTPDRVDAHSFLGK